MTFDTENPQPPQSQETVTVRTGTTSKDIDKALYDGIVNAINEDPKTDQEWVKNIANRFDVTPEFVLLVQNREKQLANRNKPVGSS